MHDNLSLKNYWKVPFREVYCDTFRMWIAECILCHIYYRLAPPPHHPPHLG